MACSFEAQKKVIVLFLKPTKTGNDIPTKGELALQTVMGLTDTGYWILDTRYWILDTKYQILDTLSWMHNKIHIVL